MKALLWIVVAVVIIGGAAYLGVMHHNGASTAATATSTYYASLPVASTATSSTSTYLMGTGSASAPSASTGASASSGSAPVASASSGSSSGPCSYLTNAQVSAIVGESVQGGVHSSAPNVCYYTSSGTGSGEVQVVTNTLSYQSYTQLPGALAYTPISGYGDQALENVKPPSSSPATIVFWSGSQSFLVRSTSLSDTEQMAKDVLASL